LVKEEEEEQVQQEEVELEETIMLQTRRLELRIKVILSGMELHIVQVDLMVLQEVIYTVVVVEVQEK